MIFTRYLVGTRRIPWGIWMLLCTGKPQCNEAVETVCSRRRLQAAGACVPSSLVRFASFFFLDFIRYRLAFFSICFISFCLSQHHLLYKMYWKCFLTVATSLMNFPDRSLLSKLSLRNNRESFLLAWTHEKSNFENHFSWICIGEKIHDRFQVLQN